MLRTFALLAAALAVVSLVASRLSHSSDEPNRVTLVWSTDNNPVRQIQADLFNKLNPGLKVIIDPANTDQQKVIVQSVGGVGPDLYDCYVPGQNLSYARAGVGLDLTDHLKAIGFDPKKQLWKLGYESSNVEGRIYSFPANTSGDAVWFNKDVFDQAKVSYPKPGWTWDDLIATAKKLTKTDATGRPIQFGLYWDFGRTWDLVYQFGGRLYTSDMTRCTLDSPEAIAGAQLSHDLIYKHKIAPSPTQEAALATAGGWGSGGMTLLMGGRVAMAIGGRWWLNRLREEKQLRLGVVEMPFKARKVSVGGCRTTGVNAKGKHIQEALKFIDFLASKEYNELVNEQADAMAPVRDFCYTDAYLHNPEHPEEDFNDVWRRATECATTLEVCPYLPGTELAPVSNQLDLLKNDAKTADQAWKKAAIDANERIIRNARQRPMLRKAYKEATGREP